MAGVPTRYAVRTKVRPNATTRTGRIVHASTHHGYPQCGVSIHGIWYTSEPVNCTQCQKEASR